MNSKRKVRGNPKPTVSDCDLDAVWPHLAEQWVSLHRKRPRYLYHYTNAQGLLGMLQSKSIWATNSRFMNDPTEIGYATRLVREVVEQSELLKGNAPWVKRLRDWVNGFLVDYEQGAKVYIACFCPEGDLLSQWRGYGAVGGGYALGFVGRHIGAQELTSLDKPEPILRKVIYDRRTQQGLVRDWLEGVFRVEQELRKHPGQLAAQQRSFQLLFAFSMFLSECMNCFKDPAYWEEQEWRIIQFGRVGDREVIKAAFRPGRTHIVPYTALDFSQGKGPYQGKLPLRLICYGPTLEPKVTERSLRLLCEAFNYNERHLTIKRSGVPFNG